MAPVVPFIPAIASSVLGAFGANSASKAASSAGNAQKALAIQQGQIAGQQSGLAKTMTGLAGDSFAAGGPALNKAMDYYRTLASGSRGAIDSALAPARAGLTDTYSGAQRGIEATTGAGPQRDRAIAEMQRQKAGQMGIMPFNAQAGAVGAMADLGGSMLNRGASLYGGAGNVLGGASNSLYGQGASLDREAQNRYAAIKPWMDFGTTMFDIWGKGSLGMGGKKPIQSRQTTMPYSSFMPGR